MGAINLSTLATVFNRVRTFGHLQIEECQQGRGIEAWNAQLGQQLCQDWQSPLALVARGNRLC